VLLDLYSRLGVGWALSSELKRPLVEEPFLMGEQRGGGAVSPLID
jgi:hypothetical protein